MRYGYPRIHVLLRREGFAVNHKRVNRLYREMGLQLRNKSPKRKVKAKLREGRSVPAGTNDVWALDFVHDQLYDGRKIRILTVIDAFTRNCQRLRCASASRVPMSWRRLSGYAPKWAIQSRSVSIRARSSCRRISTCGLTPAASNSTSRDRGSRRTMPSAKMRALA